MLIRSLSIVSGLTRPPTFVVALVASAVVHAAAVVVLNAVNIEDDTDGSSPPAIMVAFGRPIDSPLLQTNDTPLVFELPELEITENEPNDDANTPSLPVIVIEYPIRATNSGRSLPRAGAVNDLSDFRVPLPAIPAAQQHVKPLPAVIDPPIRSVQKQTPTKNSAKATPRGIDEGVALLDLPAPVYPRSCQRRDHEGLVRLNVEVRDDGSVGHIHIIEHGGCSKLDDAAIEAVRSATFRPAKRDGTPIGCTVVIPIRFWLD